MTDRRRFLQASGAGLLGLSDLLDPNFAHADAGAVLPNGIRLPKTWPPHLTELPREPRLPPYLSAPPAVIPLVGRQLFVDDFLIERTTLKRTFHRAEYHPACPVLRPDKPWEKLGAQGPAAMVFSDGVWYDPKDRLFKMWYMASLLRATAYATSTDGVRWTKPALDVRKGTNLVQEAPRDSSTIWLDLEEKDPKRRYKMFRVWRHKPGWALSAYFSPDGIHWGEPVWRSEPCGDRTTVFYNPFRKRWVFSLRNVGGPRQRRYWEMADLLKSRRWARLGDTALWTGVDDRDPQRVELKIVPQLYNLDCVAYESLLLGAFTIWRGQPGNRQKPNDVVLGYSRDGWHWHRPDRRAFCPVSEKVGDWNYANVQSAGGCCLIVGDKLHFYVSGRAGVAGKALTGECTTGLAVLRRDGFASLDAGGAERNLTTRPVRFSGKHLFVNVRCPLGELRAEVLDDKGEVIAPFTRANCAACRDDKTRLKVNWKGAADLSRLAGKPVKLRFYLTQGQLFSFWVSPDVSGASHGYVAAGGPGLTGPTDTVGQGAAR